MPEATNHARKLGQPTFNFSKITYYTLKKGKGKTEPGWIYMRREWDRFEILPWEVKVKSLEYLLQKNALHLKWTAEEK